MEEIRWRQRLATFGKALGRLSEIITAYKSRPLNDFERDGLIQRFEFTQECAWKLMKNYEEYEGAKDISGSRDTIRQAFAMGIIDNTKAWFEMLESRNLTSHVYDEQTEIDVIDGIIYTYHPLLQNLYDKMTEKKSD